MTSRTPAAAPGSATDEELTDALLTYRYLRLATVVVVTLLGVAVAYQYLQAGCWQTSISAYYFTAAHSVFVASLCAIGTTLMVYKGSSDTEDVLLNFSGFLAFIVAFVPTTREPLCGGTGLPADYVVAELVRNNITALFLVGAVVDVARRLLDRRTKKHPLSPPARTALLVGWLVLAVAFGAFVANPVWFQDNGHMLAAVTMFIGIILVVVVNAWSAQQRPDAHGYVLAYRIIAGLMAVSVVVIIGLRFTDAGFTHAVIVVEALLIIEFAVFWVVQTRELWNVTTRRDLLTEGADPTGA